MEIYIIVREDGKFVARNGSEYSYTDKLQEAKRYDSLEQAKRDCCFGNESVRTVSEIMGS
jgi:hypothetical protein